MVTAFRAARATHGNSGPTTTTVWLPNFVEIGVPLQNYSSFTFTPVWLENSHSHSKWRFWGTWSL